MMERDSNHEQKRGAADAQLDPARPRTDAEIARGVLRTEGVTALELRLVAAGRAEERERCARLCDLHAERLKHTSHKDGLGMGDAARESVCHVLAARLREVDDE